MATHSIVATSIATVSTTVLSQLPPINDLKRTICRRRAANLNFPANPRSISEIYINGSFALAKKKEQFLQYDSGNQDLDRKTTKTNNEEHAAKDKSKSLNELIDIPYTGKFTTTFGKKLISLVKQVCPQIHLQPIARPPPSAGTCFISKDPVPKNLQSGVVYQVNCADCDAFYIGKTIRQVTRRLKEHGAPQAEDNLVVSSALATSITDDQTIRRSTRNIWKTVNYAEQRNIEINNTGSTNTITSALHKHQNNTGHKIDWVRWRIISKDSRHYHLRV
ncbi:unnamed protein product, partial [Rotaria sp. Silwood2]